MGHSHKDCEEALDVVSTWFDVVTGMTGVGIVEGDPCSVAVYVDAEDVDIPAAVTLRTGAEVPITRIRNEAPRLE